MEKTINHKISEALTFLRPNAEWVLRGDDYSGLEWLDTKQTAPTLEEVETAFTQVDAWKAQQEADKATAKAAAEAKLAALGLTADDLKALGLGGN